MLNRTTDTSRKTSSTTYKLHSDSTYRQYGQHDKRSQSLTHEDDKLKTAALNNSLSLLLGVPGELFTHISSHLSPADLLSLNRVCQALHAHVSDDNTWYRAFICQVLNISAENDPARDRMLLLSRSEPTWKREFSARFNLSRRWERSLTTTTTHVPHHSTVSNMHMMPGHTLLTASLQYGVVSRSAPLTGKVMRGYLDASGNMGVGNGNPNAEFAPNLISCAITSSGGIARILWGFASGDLCLTIAPKAMDPTGRTSSRLVRVAHMPELHMGSVSCVAWDRSEITASKDELQSYYAVSGGSDGLVKLWSCTRMELECIWTSVPTITLIPSEVVKVALDMKRGLIAASFRNGDVYAWIGITQRQAMYIPASTDDNDEAPQVSSLIIDGAAPLDTPTILLAYEGSSEFHRLKFQANESKTFTIHSSMFKPSDTSSAAITSLLFEGDFKFVITGDAMGCVSVWNWQKQEAGGPMYTFEAHLDGSRITSLLRNGLVLITGSARGEVCVFDSLTFRSLRVFELGVGRNNSRGSRSRATANVVEHEQTPAERQEAEREAAINSITQLVISPDREVLFISRADKVIAWKAGSASSRTSGKTSGGHSTKVAGKKKSAATTKYQQRLDLSESIRDSLRVLSKEQDSIQRTFTRERAFRRQLDDLGLSETEAVEYLLMLSRDEANAAAATTSTADEGGASDFEPEQNIRSSTTGYNNGDDDLRMAIELSLAEARTRGDVLE